MTSWRPQVGMKLFICLVNKISNDVVSDETFGEDWLENFVFKHRHELKNILWA
jgi:hypothetical protein